MSGSATQRLNFLIFITDQFNPRCLGYAGHPLVRTPNIDRLANEGVVFTRMYSNMPMCTPARATMFTGLTPRGHRVRMNGLCLDPCVPTFTGALSDAGYHTHCCGKIHLGIAKTPTGMRPEDADPAVYPELRAAWLDGRIDRLPLPYYGLESVDFVGGHGHGSYGQYVNWLRREHPGEAKKFFEPGMIEPPTPAFDLFNRKLFQWSLPAELHPMTWICDRTIEFLERAGDRPFCLMCSIQDPHSPFAAPVPYCLRHDPKDIPVPIGREGEYDELPPHFRRMYKEDIITSGNKGQAMKLTDPWHGQCAAQYFGLIDMIDSQVGRVMDALRRSPHAGNTVVLFVADHGEALGDHGMWGKGPYHFDSVIRVPFIAWCPGWFRSGAVHEGPVSFLDLAPTVLDIAGVPIPEGPTPPAPEAPGAPPAWPGRSLVSVFTGKDTSTDTCALVEMDEDYLGFKMRTLVTKRHRITCYSGKEYGELFDLEHDPNELHNLWNSPTHRITRDQLRIQLLNEIMRTDISVPRQLSRS